MQVVQSTEQSVPVLVTGLPEPTSTHLYWCEAITRIIRRHWSPRHPTTKTMQAEKGLGIEGEPRYFYAMRTEPAFGFAVFFFRQVLHSPWPADTHGATPFDTGGLWHGGIVTQPPAGPKEKRRIFRQHQVSLPRWIYAFNQYISTNYHTINDYIEGHVPLTGIPRIISHRPNTSRAWTWEVRVPTEWMNEGVDLAEGFLPEQEQPKYLDWLWSDSGLDDTTCRSIQLWMQENMTVAPLGVSASRIAETALLHGIVK